MTAKLILGVDFGGTKIASIQYATNQTAFTYHVTPLENNDPLKLLIEHIDNAKTGDTQISAVGIGVPGPVDKNEILTDTLANVQDFKTRQLARRISKRVGVPVYLLNDAAGFALGEAHVGDAQDFETVAYYTLGTGIGFKVTKNRKLTNDINEAGHHIVDPFFAESEHGELEELCSGTGIAQLASRMYPRIFTGVSAKTVFEMANKRNPSLFAKDVLDRSAQYLAASLSNTIKTTAPDAIVFGGSVAANQEWVKSAYDICRSSYTRTIAKWPEILFGQTATACVGPAIYAQQMLANK